MKDAMLLSPKQPKRFETSEAISLPGIDDYHAWAFEQADYLRKGRFDLLDLPNVIDEIEAVGRSEFRSFKSNIEIVLVHLLKWDYQTAKRGLSWENSIGEHRDRIRDDLEDSASMERKRDEAVAAAYRLARRKASRETRLPVKTFPEACPYSWEQIMDAPYELNRD